MLKHYLAALLSLGRDRAPAYSALPDAPACPCGQWGVIRADGRGCVARCKELFAQLDQELDAWEAEHGWLYR
jgi:hypothetical protein